MNPKSQVVDNENISKNPPIWQNVVLPSNGKKGQILALREDVVESPQTGSVCEWVDPPEGTDGYTKAEADEKFALKGASYTKEESDEKYEPKGGGGGTEYTAGDGISISPEKVISADNKYWTGTQAQYEALETIDQNTLYLIYEE